MPGLAGIGYALLRLSNLGPVPSILLLEPPVRRAPAAPS
jgi:lantibiotic modifying enzyme